jgi:hypothetical protein
LPVAGPGEGAYGPLDILVLRGERASVRQYSSTETGLVTCVLIPLPLFFDHRPPASSGGNPGGK